MDKVMEIVRGQIDKHRKIHDAAIELGEHKMALEYLDIAKALETVLEAVE